MKLLFSPTSPYTRKVRVVAHECGYADRVELVTTNPFAPDAELPAHNPLGKVPTLIGDEGESLYDSRVICEYLDSMGGTGLFPPPGHARWKALGVQALADGMMDAVVAIRLDSLRPEDKRYAPWRERQLAVVRRGLAALAADDAYLGTALTIGHIAAACALGYLDLRLASEDWRAEHPALADWYAAISERPSLIATAHPSS